MSIFIFHNISIASGDDEKICKCHNLHWCGCSCTLYWTLQYGQYFFIALHIRENLQWCVVTGYSCTFTKNIWPLLLWWIGISLRILSNTSRFYDQNPYAATLPNGFDDSKPQNVLRNPNLLSGTCTSTQWGKVYVEQ